LHMDMQRVIGEQQFQAVSLAAAHVNEELTERLEALELIAKQMEGPLIANPAALQTHLEQRPLLQLVFNAGAFVTGLDGTAIANVSDSAKRVGVNYMERDFIVATLKEGKSAIGRPVMGKQLKAPVLVMSAPVHDAQGKVIAALAGVTNLGEQSFLDTLSNSSYGKTGGFLVVAPEHKLFVTATDKTRIMTPVPEPGLNTMHDRFMQGYEGYGIAVNSKGVEVLNAAKAIPAAGWFLVAVMSSAEAFAPIYAMQQRILFAAVLLTLLTGALTWWTLQRQLAPMLKTAQKLTLLATTNLPVTPLHVTRQDEIGAMVGGFNHLLETLGKREKLLTASEQRARNFFEKNSCVMLLINPATGEIVDANPAASRYYGYAPVQLIGMNICNINMATSERVAEERQKALREERNYFLFLHRLASGEVRNVEVYSTPIETGGHSQLFSIIHDVHEKHLAQQALAESEFRWKFAIEGAGDGLWDWDVPHSTVFFSTRWKTMLGFTEDEIGSSLDEWSKRVHPDDLARVTTDVQTHVDGLTPRYTNEHRVSCKDGSWKWILDRGLVVSRDTTGKPLRVIGTHHDITERHQAEAAREALQTALQRAVKEADAANNSKSRFLAAASHDLRQPLAALALFVGMLDTAVKPGREKLVFHMQSAVNELSRLLNALLNVSKIDAGGVVPMVSDFSIEGLCASLLSTHEGSAAKKGLQLRCRHAPHTMLRTDQALFGRIIGNLVDNAVQYTSHGGVLIAMRRHAGKRWIEVWDTGIGIAPNQIPLIFEEFRRLGDGARTQGSGLGLAIASKTAALLGLKIRVASRPGRGSMFAIELPECGTQALPQALALSASHSSPRSFTVGLVEDNLRVLNALVLGLENLGHTVFAGTTGEAMLAEMGRRVPDVVVSDYRLAAGETGMDVIDLARAHFGDDLPGIVLTGDTDANELRKIAEEGIAVYTKPVTLADLQGYLLQAVQRSV
jgi:PAS domain S-box-containing protein